jgi:hypothetical protein
MRQVLVKNSVSTASQKISDERECTSLPCGSSYVQERIAEYPVNRIEEFLSRNAATENLAMRLAG